jgi:regulator of sigma E protease
MDFISEIPVIGQIVTIVLPFLILLSVVVFIHEFGHYIVGRWCGIHAEVFSIGFGKELGGWTDKRGTRWRVAAIPLGGYVKFLGDEDVSSRTDDAKIQSMEASERARSFGGADLWRRALTVLAGPTANFLLAIAVFACMALYTGLPSNRPIIGAVLEDAPLEIAFQKGDEILSVDGAPVETFEDVIVAFEAARSQVHTVTLRRGGEVVAVESGPIAPAFVASVRDNGPAGLAGVKAGEVVTAIDGAPIVNFSELQQIIAESEAREMVFTIRAADGSLRDISITPQISLAQTRDGGTVTKPLIGISSSAVIGPEADTPGFLRALQFGVERTWWVVSSSLTYVWEIITGGADASALGGPIKIATLSGDAASAGILSFVGMIAMLSASIGLINLFPIPVLDGGHLVFYAIEAVRGRPLHSRLVEVATGVGLGLVILLMVFVTYNDLLGL